MRRVLRICCAGWLLASAAHGEDASSSRLVWSRSRTTWIYERPRLSARRVGYIRPGASVAVREAPAPSNGCRGGFVGIEPRGYICLDRTTTRDEDDHFVRAAQSFVPATGVLPFRYALSNGAPMYFRVPAPEEADNAERWFGPAGTHGALSWGNRAHEELAEARAVSAEHGMPDFLPHGSADRAADRRLIRRTIPLGSMLAYARSFQHAGRTWLLAADGSVVPANRVRPYRASAFAGVALDAETRLPLAFARASGAAKLVRDTDGSFRALPQRWAARQSLRLDGAAVASGSRRFWPTAEHESGRRVFASEAEIRLVEAVNRPPAVIGAGQRRTPAIARTKGAARLRRPAVGPLGRVSPYCTGSAVQLGDPPWGREALRAVRVVNMHTAFLGRWPGRRRPG